MNRLNPIKLSELLKRRPGDFLALIDGDPRYCGAVLSNILMSREEGAIFQMAREHVWFMSRFGDVGSASDGDKVYSESPEYFGRWLEIGCPGVDIESFDKYLKMKPL